MNLIEYYRYLFHVFGRDYGKECPTGIINRMSQGVAAPVRIPHMQVHIDRCFSGDNNEGLPYWDPYFACSLKKKVDEMEKRKKW